MSESEKIICSDCRERIRKGETDFSDICSQCSALNGDEETQEILLEVLVHGLKKGRFQFACRDFLIHCLTEYQKGETPHFLIKTKETSATDIWLAFDYFYQIDENPELLKKQVTYDIASQVGCGFENIKKINKKYENQALNMISKLNYYRNLDDDMYLTMKKSYEFRVKHAKKITKERHEKTNENRKNKKSHINKR